MKVQSTEGMVTHIRAILEQNQDPQELVSNDDIRTLSLEALIANALEEAVAMAVQNADESLFQNINTAVFAASWEQYEGDASVIMDLYDVQRSEDGSINRIIKKVMPQGKYIISGGIILDAETGEPVGEPAGEAAGTVVVEKPYLIVSEEGQVFALKNSFVKNYSKYVINLPQETQRILQIGSDGWNGYVKDILNKSSSVYRMCQNRYLAAVGVKDRPVAFRDFGAGGRRIEVFPASRNYITLDYIPRSVIKKGYLDNRDVEIDKNTFEPVEEEEMQGVIECDDAIYEGACFYCAYLVAMVQGWQTANTYRQEAVEALQIVTKENMRLAAAKLTADN